MKKNRLLILLLCLTLLVQTLALPVFADETESTSGEEVTEAATEEAAAPMTSFEVEDVRSNDVTVLNGCRTIDGMYPLGGSDRMLETAQAAFVYEVNTQTVIYSYNPDLRLYPGTLTKMLAALIAIEKCDLEDTIIVNTTSFSTLPAGALNAKLKYGEEVTLRDLLYLMMLESANDAAISIAEHVATTQDRFVTMMNEKLQQIGCTNTHLVDCHGLSTTDQYTTARDMAKIVEACTANETFCEIFEATSYTVPETNKSAERSLRSLNYLTEQTIVPKFNYDDVVGGMPSYGSSTGASIVCTAERSSMNLIFVVMGATRKYNDDTGVATYYGNFEEVIDLLEYTYNGFRIYRMLYNGQALKQFQVSNGEQDVVGSPAINIDTVLPSGTKQANIIEKYSITNNGLNAPISAGDQIATVQVWYGSSCLAEVELYAMCDIRESSDTGLSISSASRDDSNLGDFLAFLGVLCLIIVVALGGYLGYNSFRRSMIRARRRRRRASRRRSR